MDKPPRCKWRHFTGAISVCGVLGYLRYALSYRAVEELLRERGGSVDYTTGLRWVPREAPDLDKRCRPHLTAPHDSYRVDETYIKLQTQGYYLYRAVDAAGQSIDVLLRKPRDATAAARFFRQPLRATHTAPPRVIPIATTAASPPAFETLPQEGQLPANCTPRQGKYFNNVIAPAHRFITRRLNPGLSCGSCRTAQQPLKGYETRHRSRKGQLQGVPKGESLAQNRVIAEGGEVAAEARYCEG